MVRTISKVVLGDLLFDTGYGSSYPEDVVGGGRSLDRLYVCRWCFRYTGELIPYAGHVVSLVVLLFLLRRRRRRRRPPTH